VAKKPTVQERLDIGFEIMECLLIKKKPLSDELVHRYARIYIKSNFTRIRPEYYKNAYNNLDRIVDLLSRCTPPVHFLVMKDVCMCSSESMKLYNSIIMTPLRKRIMHPDIWKTFEICEIPRFEKVLVYAVTNRLIQDIPKIN